MLDNCTRALRKRKFIHASQIMCIRSIAKLSNLVSNTFLKIKNYFRREWGAPFVIGFVVLLIVAATSTSLGLETLAKEVANYAYFALLFAVALQLASFLRNDRNCRCNS
jgi:hypothetical protein